MSFPMPGLGNLMGSMVPGGGNMLTYASLFLGVAALVMAIVSFIKKSTPGPKGDKGDKGAKGDIGPKGDPGAPLKSNILTYMIEVDQKTLVDTSGNSTQNTSEQLSRLSIEDPSAKRGSMIMNNKNDNGSIKIEVSNDRLIIRGSLNMHELVVATLTSGTTDIIDFERPTTGSDLSFQIPDEWFILTEEEYLNASESYNGLLTYPEMKRTLQEDTPLQAYASATTFDGGVVDHTGYGTRQEDPDDSDIYSSTHFTMTRPLITISPTALPAESAITNIVHLGDVQSYEEKYIIEFMIEYSI